MFNWFKRKPKEPAPPIKLKVGKITLEVELASGEKYDFVVEGRYFFFDGEPFVEEAKYCADRLIVGWKQRGVIYINKDLLVPFHQVKAIRVLTRDKNFEIEVEKES